MTTEPIIVWEFRSKDPHLLDFCCTGTEAEAKKLYQSFVERDCEYEYSIRQSDFPKIADILTDLEISNTIANDH